MLSGGLDLLYRAALAASHKPIIRVEIWRGGSLLVPDLLVNNGEVTATLTSRVSRVATCVTTGDYYDVISPFTDMMRCYRGIELGDGTPLEWPIFVGRLTDSELTPEGLLDINAEDNAGSVIANGFEFPLDSNVGQNVRDQVYDLISGRLAGATFGTSDEYTLRMPRLTWEHDPGQALDEIATAAGSYWYALANGDFVLRRVPWTIDVPPIIDLYDGDGGTILTSGARKDRRNVYNQVTVTGERLEGSVPVYDTQSDESPASPTYINGPFGIRNKLLSLNTPTSFDAARSAAFSYLKRSTALTEAWSFTCTPDAALELGDVLTLHAQGRVSSRQVVASISVPLVVEGSMAVQCRAQVIGGSLDG
jgi:hypothetical protein